MAIAFSSMPSPTTPSTCSTPTAGSRAGTPAPQRFKGYTARGNHRPALLPLLYRRGSRHRPPEQALEIARTEGRFEREGWRVRKDGTRFWAHVVIDPIVDPDGALLGLRQDHPRPDRARAKRPPAAGQLEQAREQLFQAQKMEAIGQLTGGIAHDFNNLLMAVLGSLELVRKRVPRRRQGASGCSTTPCRAPSAASR